MTNGQIKAPDAEAHGPLTIQLSNISKFYSGVPALREVSIGFYAGEVHEIGRAHV